MTLPATVTQPKEERLPQRSAVRSLHDFVSGNLAEVEKHRAILEDTSRSKDPERKKVVIEICKELDRRYGEFLKSLATLERNTGHSLASVDRMAAQEHRQLTAQLYGLAGMAAEREGAFLSYAMWSLRPENTPGLNLISSIQYSRAPQREFNTESGKSENSLSGYGTERAEGLYLDDRKKFALALKSLRPLEQERTVEAIFQSASSALLSNRTDRVGRYRELLSSLCEELSNPTKREEFSIRLKLLDSQFYQMKGATQPAIASAIEARERAFKLNQTTPDKSYTRVVIAAGSQEIALLSALVKEEPARAEQITRTRAWVESQVSDLRQVNGDKAPGLRDFRRELVGLQLQEIYAHVQASNSAYAENTLIPRLKAHYSHDHPDLSERLDKLLAGHQRGNSWSGKTSAAWRNFTAEWNRSSFTEYVGWGLGGAVAGATYGATAGAASGNPYAVASGAALGVIIGGVGLGLKNVGVGWRRIADGGTTGISSAEGGLSAWIDGISVFSDVIPLVSAAGKLAKAPVRAAMKAGLSDEALRLGKVIGQEELEASGKQIFSISASVFKELGESAQTRKLLESTYGAVWKQIEREFTKDLAGGATNFTAKEIEKKLGQAVLNSVRDEGLLSGGLALVNLGLLATTLANQFSQISNSDRSPEDKSKERTTALTQVAQNLSAMLLWGKASHALHTKLEAFPGSNGAPPTISEDLKRFTRNVLDDAPLAQQRLRTSGLFSSGSLRSDAMFGLGIATESTLKILEDPSVIKDLGIVLMSEMLSSGQSVKRFFDELRTKVASPDAKDRVAQYEEAVESAALASIDHYKTDITRASAGRQRTDRLHEQGISLPGTQPRAKPSNELPTVQTKSDEEFALNLRMRSHPQSNLQSALGNFTGEDRVIAEAIVARVEQARTADLAKTLDGNFREKDTVYVSGPSSAAATLVYQSRKTNSERVKTTNSLREASLVIIDEEFLHRLKTDENFQTEVINAVKRDKLAFLFVPGTASPFSLNPTASVEQLTAELAPLVREISLSRKDRPLNDAVNETLTRRMWQVLEPIDEKITHEHIAARKAREGLVADNLIDTLQKMETLLPRFKNDKLSLAILELVYPAGGASVDLPLERLRTDFRNSKDSTMDFVQGKLKLAVKATEDELRTLAYKPGSDGRKLELEELLDSLHDLQDGLAETAPSPTLLRRTRTIAAPPAQTPFNLDADAAKKIRARMKQDGYSDQTIDLAFEIVSQSAKFVSHGELRETLSKQHQSILKLAQERGVVAENILFVSPKSGKSFDAVARLHQEATGTPPGQFISRADLDRRLKSMPPLEQKNLMVVMIDDLAGSGDSLLKAASELRNGIEYEWRGDFGSLTYREIVRRRGSGRDAEIIRSELDHKHQPFFGTIVVAPAVVSDAAQLQFKRERELGDQQTLYLSLESETGTIHSEGVEGTKWFAGLTPSAKQVVRNIVGPNGFGRCDLAVLFEHAVPNNNNYLFTAYFSPFIHRFPETVPQHVTQKRDASAQAAAANSAVDKYRKGKKKEE